MTRHSKNSCAGPVFTYHERQRTNWGTQSARITSHSIKPFDCCALCLHSAVDALVCQKGHLFCKECIYNSLMQQKQIHKQQEALRESREQKQRERQERKQQESDELDINRFIQSEHSITAMTTASASSSPAASSSSTAVMPYEPIQTSKGTAYIPNPSAAANSNKPILPSFWLPSLTPSATDDTTTTTALVASTTLSTPAAQPAHHTTTCPAGSHSLRLKQLRPLRFTLSATARPCCPSCSKEYTNSSRLTVLYACGHVMCTACVAATRAGGSGGSGGGGEVECVKCGRESGVKEQVVLETGTGYAGNGGKMAVAQNMPAFVC